MPNACESAVISPLRLVLYSIFIDFHCPHDLIFFVFPLCSNMQTETLEIDQNTLRNTYAEIFLINLK